MFSRSQLGIIVNVEIGFYLSANFINYFVSVNFWSYWIIYRKLDFVVEEFYPDNVSIRGFSNPVDWNCEKIIERIFCWQKVRDFPFFRSQRICDTHSLGERAGALKRGREGGELDRRDPPCEGLTVSEKKSFTCLPPLSVPAFTGFKWIWGQSWKHDTRHTPISRGSSNQFSEY